MSTTEQSIIDQPTDAPGGTPLITPGEQAHPVSLSEDNARRGRSIAADCREHIDAIKRLLLDPALSAEVRALATTLVLQEVNGNPGKKADGAGHVEAMTVALRAQRVRDLTYVKAQVGTGQNAKTADQMGQWFGNMTGQRFGQIAG